MKLIRRFSRSIISTTKEKIQELSITIESLEKEFLVASLGDHSITISPNRVISTCPLTGRHYVIAKFKSPSKDGTGELMIKVDDLTIRSQTIANAILSSYDKRAKLEKVLYHAEGILAITE